jgi:hypothetical protein
MLNVKPDGTYKDHWALGVKRNTMGSSVGDWYAKFWVPVAGCCERGDEPYNCHTISGVICLPDELAAFQERFFSL